MTPKDLIQLCFKLARAGEFDSLKQIVPTISTDVFGEVQQFLTQQGIAPILHARIVKNQYDRFLPKEFVEGLRQAYLHNAARNLFANKQLEEILTRLEQHAIPVMLLKGAHFYSSIYKNTACRTMSDLDLLFQQTTLAKGVVELESLGYQMSGPSWEGPQHHLPPMSKKGYPFPVEVHNTLAAHAINTALTPGLLWKTAQPGSVFGHPVWLLSPTIALFYVCLHAAYQHLFINAARALFDIDALVRHYGKDVSWDTFWDYTEQEDCILGTAFILKLSTQLLSTPLPAKVNEKISSIAFAEEIEESVFEVMLSGEQLPDSPPEDLVNTVKWWFTKMRKLSNSVFHAHDKRINNSPSSRMQAGTFFHRTGFLLKDYFSAILNLRHINRNQQKMKINLKLRRWLRIR
jgi:hypothetical protein